MIKWVIKQSGYAPIMESPVSRIKLADISLRYIVESLNEVDGEWEKIKWGNKIGWMKSIYLEEYKETLPKDSVYIKNIQTKDEFDAQQYIDWNGIKQVNMCGQLCVAYLLGLSLSEYLDVWQIKEPSLWKRIFGQGRARGTGPSELIEMMNIFSVDGRLLSDKIDIAYSPHMLHRLSNSVIVSVRINSLTGRLNGSGILHWVVVTDSLEERSGYGTVRIYNPYPNRIEEYSFTELLASARSPYGVVME
jgi:hypothetical protein